MENVVRSWSEQEVLAKIISAIVVFGNGTEKCQKMAVCVGLPELSDSVDTQWPTLG